MKKIILIALVVLASLLGIWIILNRVEIINGPSSEMKQLREVAVSLNIPPPIEQREEDMGCFSDPLGAKLCIRYIIYKYQDDSYWPGFKSKIEKSGWTVVSYDESSYSAWNGDQANPICLSRRSNESESRYTLSVESAEDDSCATTLREVNMGR